HGAVQVLARREEREGIRGIRRGSVAQLLRGDQAKKRPLTPPPAVMAPLTLTGVPPPMPEVTKSSETPSVSRSPTMAMRVPSGDQRNAKTSCPAPRVPDAFTAPSATSDLATKSSN